MLLLAFCFDGCGHIDSMIQDKEREDRNGKQHIDDQARRGDDVRFISPD